MAITITLRANSGSGIPISLTGSSPQTLDTPVLAAAATLLAPTVLLEQTVVVPVLNTNFDVGKYGPSFWFDADDPATLTIVSTDKVSQWDDKSGNDRHVSQGTLGVTPTLVTAPNGRASVYFNSDWLQHDAGSDAMDFSPMEFFAVQSHYSQPGTWPRSISAREQDNWAGDWQSPNWNTASQPGPSMRFEPDGNGSPTIPITLSTTLFIHEGRTNGTTAYHRINGGTEESFSSGNPADLRYFRLGGAIEASSPTIDPSYGMQGEITEVIIVNGTLTEQQRNEIRSYLAEKWSVSASNTTELYIHPPIVASDQVVSLPVINTWVPFDPLDLAPSAWFDASDASTITQVYSEYGTTVSQWDDKSGNGMDLAQSIKQYQPSRGDTRNGRRVLNFDTAILYNSNPIAGLAMDDFTVFIVAEENTTGNYRGFLSVHSTTGSDWNRTDAFAIDSSDNTNYAVLAVNSTVATMSGSGSAPLAVRTAQRSGTSGSVWENSVPGTGSTTTAAGAHTGGFLVGGRFDLGNINYIDSFLDGWIAEVFIFDYALTTDERETVEAYLYSKWLGAPQFSAVYGPSIAWAPSMPVLAAPSTVPSPTVVGGSGGAQTLEASVLSAPDSVAAPQVNLTAFAPVLAAPASTLAPTLIQQQFLVAPVVAAPVSTQAPQLNLQVFAPVLAAPATPVAPTLTQQQFLVAPVLATAPTLLAPALGVYLTVPVLGTTATLLAPQINLRVSAAVLAAPATLLVPALSWGLQVPLLASDARFYMAADTAHFFDNFNRADSTTSINGAGLTWTDLNASDWGIQSNKVYRSTSASNSGVFISSPDGAGDDYIFEATVYENPGSSTTGAAIFVRRTDDNNFLQLKYDGTYWILRLVESGVETSVGTEFFTTTPFPMTVTIHVIGGRVRWSVKGTTYVGTPQSTTLAALASGALSTGRPGLRYPTFIGNAVLFDNVHYTEIRQSVFPPTVAMAVSAPVITAPAAIISPALTQQQFLDVPVLATTATVLAPALGATIFVPVFGASTTLLAPQVNLALAAPIIVSTATIAAPALTQQQFLLTPVLAAPSTTIEPQVNLTVSLPLLSAPETVLAPTAVYNQTLVAPALTTSATLLAPSVPTMMFVPVLDTWGGVLLTEAGDTLVTESGEPLLLEETTGRLHPPTVELAVGSQQLLAPVLAAPETLLAPRIALTTSVLDAPASVLAPTLTQQQFVAAQVLAAPTTVYAPTLNIQQLLDVPVLAAPSTLLAPTLIAQQFLVAPVLAAPPALYGPTLNLAISAPALVTSSTVPALTLIQQQFVIVPALAAPDTLLAPQVNLTIAAPVLSAPSTVLAPTLNVEQRLILTATVAAPDTLLAPSVSLALDSGFIPAPASVLAPQVNLTVFAPALSTPSTTLAPALQRVLTVPVLSSPAALLAPAQISLTIFAPAITAPAALPVPGILTSGNLAVPVIDAPATLYAPTVLRLLDILTPPVVAAPASLLSPQVSVYAVVPLLVSTATTFAPSVGLNLAAPVIAAPATAQAPSISLAVESGYVPAPSTLYPPQVNLTIVAPLLAAPAATLSPQVARTVALPVVTTTTTLYAPQVNLTISLGTVSSPATVLSPSVAQWQPVALPVITAAATPLAPSIVTVGLLQPPSLGTSATPLAPTVIGSQILTAPVVGTASTLYAPQVDLRVSAPALSAPASPLAPALSQQQFITNTPLSAPATPLAPSVSLSVGGQTVVTSNVFWNPAVANNQPVTVAAITATEAVLPPGIVTVVTVSTPSLDAANILFAPTVLAAGTLWVWNGAMWELGKIRVLGPGAVWDANPDLRPAQV